MAIYSLDGHKPQIADSAFIAESADIIGKVTIGEQAGIWFGAVLRGDLEPIIIGNGSNVQDNSVVHTERGAPAIVGKNCTIGHKALIHGCVIHDNCLIGMGAIIMNYAEIGEESLVGAGALVTEHKKFPPRSLIIGAPARAVRCLTDEEIEGIRKNVKSYQDNAARFRRNLELTAKANF